MLAWKPVFIKVYGCILLKLRMFRRIKLKNEHTEISPFLAPPFIYSDLCFPWMREEAIRRKKTAGPYMTCGFLTYEDVLKRQKQ